MATRTYKKTRPEENAETSSVECGWMREDVGAGGDHPIQGQRQEKRFKSKKTLVEFKH